ncbi:MAG: SPOR domain-containing protein [Candidatus Omnitrophota bacterium]
MAEYNLKQLEIFNQKDSLGKYSARRDPNFLKKIFSYEKIIITIIIFIVINIVSFSLGVEKGRHLARISNQPSQESTKAIKNQTLQNNIPRIEVANKDNQDTSSVTKPQEIKIIKEENQSQITQKNNYTIQVASFSDKTYIQKELITLKNKGYSAFAISKGKMSIICVGKFQDKEKAKKLATHLQKKYRDCLVRRL